MPAERDVLQVLLIEDDEDDYLLTLDLFDRAYGKSYSLTWVSDPDKALAILGSADFDVCLVDYQLGSTTGIELIRSILHERSSHMAIILLTGMDNHAVDLQASASHLRPLTGRQDVARDQEQR